MKYFRSERFGRLVLSMFAIGLLQASFGGTLTISGDYQVASGGESYDSVTVSAAATISGGALTVANGGSIAVSAGTANFTCPLVLGAAKASGVTIAPASGATARFNGAISGPADIDINGDGTIYFSGANTFDGDLVITKGVFHAEGNGAFGSTSGTTTLKVNGNSSVAQIHFDSGAWSEAFFLSQGGTWGTWTVCFNGACTFNGPVTCAATTVTQWWRFTANANVVFNGGFNAFTGYYPESSSASAQVTYNCAVQATVICPQKGTWEFACPVDIAYRDAYNAGWKNTRDLLQFRPGTFRFSCIDALGETGNCGRYYANTAGDTTIVLGEDQHFSHFVDAGTAKHIITSEAGKVLHVDSQVAFGATSQGFSGAFAGSAGLSVEGPLPMTLSGGSTTSGSLVLTNGAQVTMGSGSSWAGKVVIADDGGEKLLLPNGVSFSVSELWVGGEKKPDGYYGGADSTARTKLDCLGGNGVITVGNPSAGDVAKWTAGGSSTSIADGNNWDIEREPAYADGDSAVTFASNGEAAEITHDVFWKSIAFADRAAFSLTGTGLISLSGGFSIATAADPSTVRKFTVAAPYRQISGQTTTVPANTTLAFDGAVSSASGMSVGFDGAGTVELNAANAFGGSLLFAGDLSVLATASGAFGSADVAVAFNNAGTVDLRGVSVAGPSSFSGAKTIVAPQFVTNVFEGPVTFAAATTYTFFSRRGQHQVFRGGLATAAGASATPAQLYVSWDSGCNTDVNNPYVLEITKTPVSADHGLLLRLINTHIETVISVSSNRFGNVSHTVCGNVFRADGTSSTRLRCAAPYAFNYDSNLLLGISSNQKQAGYLDLGGFDQGFASAVGYQKADSEADYDHLNVVYSATPALLCTRHTTAAVNRWTFTGAAGYRMEGSGSVTLKASSESTGELSVTNGVLSLASGCLWPKCSQVTVSDSGTFKVASAGALGRKANVSISDDGTLDLAAGVNLKVHSLVINGVERYGEWGSPESGAEQTDSHLTGTGKICGRTGIVLFVR